MSDKKARKDCFIIMPISDPEGYPSGHFGHVYEDIIKPSCELSNYTAIRADDVKETNLIHTDILKKLIDAPLAICDLSTRNPNVLFELGIRQAFDKPVVLIQENETPKIFDISPLRVLTYSKEMKYHEVLAFHDELKGAIDATVKATADPENINSIVKLLALSAPANIPDLENGKESMLLGSLQAEMKEMRKMVEMSMMRNREVLHERSIGSVEYRRVSRVIDKLESSSYRNRVSESERQARLQMLGEEIKDLMMCCDEKSDHMHFRRLMERVHRAMS